MKTIPFAPKWPRLARLSLALATLAAPVCTLAQAPKYTIVDLGPVGPSWSQGQPFVVSGSGLVSCLLVAEVPARASSSRPMAAAAATRAPKPSSPRWWAPNLSRPVT